MHMINDKGEAVYYNYVHKNNKNTGWCRALAPPLSTDGTGSAARAATLPRSSRRSATLPGMVSVPIDRRFSGGKNAKEKHRHERITY